MNIIDAINSAERTLAHAGIESARLDAEVLLAHALGTDRAELYLRRDDTVDAGVLKSLGEALTRRSRGCPVAYITGTKEFWSIPIKVNEDVLVPRPETETLVEEAVGIARETRGNLRVLDLCTGSGCIAAALAKEIPGARLVAADVSARALEVAQANLAPACGRVEFMRSDLFENLDADRPFDMIVTNPPYVRDDEFPSLSREIVKYEPRVALSAGESGLDFIARIIEDAQRFLRPGGWLLMEIGHGQAESSISMATAAGGYDTARMAKDLSGTERVLLLRRDALG